MSIIFKKLKTLKNEPVDPEDIDRERLQNGTPVYTVKNFVFSSRGALIIVAVLFAFGIISFYTLSFLKEYLDSASGNAIVVQHVKKDVPENLPASTDQTPSPPETDVPEGSDPGSTAPGTESDPGASPGQGTSHGPESHESAGFKVPEHFTRLFRKNTAEVSNPQADPAKTSENNLIYIPKPFLKDIPDKNIPALSKKSVMPEPTIESESPASKKSKDSSISTKGTSEVRIKAQEEILRTAKEKRTRKTSAVSLLAEDLEEAIEKKDSVRIHTLFEALAKESGQTSPYYLKLKAFQDIREENYDSAKKLLNQVLAKDVNDFDANFNMAVIEIREKKFDVARPRLTRLKEIHPSKPQIDDLLNSF